MFPDFQIKNYYNKIIFCDKEITINNRRQIFLFKFKNELYNVIAPLNIEFKKRKYNFKFLIEHNLLNKINIFINHTQQNPYL